MTVEDAAARVARLYPTHFLRGYVRAKLRSDPMYRAVAERLRGQSFPLYDLGCGAGVLAFYLRDCGFTFPIVGVDHDAAKIAAATTIGQQFHDLAFKRGDAREPVPGRVNVAALDVLHYFTDAEQTMILDSIAAAIPPGGMAVVRDAVRDGSFRYRLTAAQETFSRVIRWLKADRLNFPTPDRIIGPFLRRGFTQETIPMWGRTPFNNYLFVFNRSRDGITNE